MSQLPEAFPVALSVVQEAAGAVLIPWLSTQPVLDDGTCEVCSSCHSTHFHDRAGMIEQAGTRCQSFALLS